MHGTNCLVVQSFERWFKSKIQRCTPKSNWSVFMAHGVFSYKFIQSQCFFVLESFDRFLASVLPISDHADMTCAALCVGTTLITTVSLVVCGVVLYAVLFTVCVIVILRRRFCHSSLNTVQILTGAEVNIEKVVLCCPRTRFFTVDQG